MKKIIFILYFAFLATGTMIAQSGLRIGNMEMNFGKQGNDTVVRFFQITTNEPIKENANNNDKKKVKNHYFRSNCYIGVSFMVPEHSDDYYRIWGGNTYHLDIGLQERYRVTRHFSLLGTLQYSFYNYRMKDLTESPAFANEVIGHTIEANSLSKQVYRSNNIGAGLYTRFYLAPAKQHTNTSGLYIDCGVQGDFSYSRFFKTKSNSHGKEKYRDGYAFNPFNASACVRLGWNKIAIVAHYRFTDVFNKDVIPMDLPPLSIGIQFH